MSAQAAPSAELPPPTSGTFQEISFRRLLKSCDEIIAGDTKGRDDLAAWQSSPVFHHVRVPLLTLPRAVHTLQLHLSCRAHLCISVPRLLGPRNLASTYSYV